jgi:hypothetical protein
VGDQGDDEEQRAGEEAAFRPEREEEPCPEDGRVRRAAKVPRLLRWQERPEYEKDQREDGRPADDEEGDPEGERRLDADEQPEVRELDDGFGPEQIERDRYADQHRQHQQHADQPATHRHADRPECDRQAVLVELFLGRKRVRRSRLLAHVRP